MVAKAIAHELAQQWFGNMVTPTWWDNLWLAEGIATAFEYWLIGDDANFTSWNVRALSILLFQTCPQFSYHNHPFCLSTEPLPSLSNTLPWPWTN